jgi:DNA polymerase-3 subunit epsilon
MHEVVIIDFETTGLSPQQGDRATEVAAVVVAEGRIVDRFQSLMNGGRSIPSFIQQLTGITNRMIQGAPKSETVMGQLHDFIAGRPLVAHNASFDRNFLGAELERIGRACPKDMLCSMMLARRIYPEAPNHRLETLIRHVRIPPVGQYHRAMADAEMTGLFWLAMLAKLKRDFCLPEVPFPLLQRLQTTPKSGVGKCVETFRKRHWPA